MEYSSDRRLPMHNDYGLGPLPQIGGRGITASKAERLKPIELPKRESGISIWPVVKGLIVLTSIAGAFIFTIQNIDRLKFFLAVKEERVRQTSHGSRKIEKPPVMDSKDQMVNRIPVVENKILTQRTSEVIVMPFQHYHIIVSSYTSSTAANEGLKKTHSRFSSAYLVQSGDNFRIAADSIRTQKNIAETTDSLKKHYENFWLLRK